MAVTGQVSQPAIRQGAYLHWPDGRATTLPGMYGIAYNARVGDRAFGWAADHVEPGVSIAHADERADYALHYLTCIGNHAEVTSGLARGATGVVTGEHARLLVDFAPEILDDLMVGDTIQIRATGPRHPSRAGIPPSSSRRPARRSPRRSASGRRAAESSAPW